MYGRGGYHCHRYNHLQLDLEKVFRTHLDGTELQDVNIGVQYFEDYRLGFTC